MGNARFRLLELQRLPHHGPEDTLVFSSGVNAIVGAPNTGKSKWLRMLDYVLGDDNKAEDVFEDLAEKYESVSLRCSFDGADEVTIERRWKEPKLKTKALVNGTVVTLADLRLDIMSRLGIPVMHFPQGNPHGPRAWPELGWRSLLRHIYRRQHMWTDIADQQPDVEQHAAIAQFLGLASELFSAEYAELVAKEKRIQELTYVQNQYMSMLADLSRDVLAYSAESGSLTAEHVDAALQKLVAEKAENARKRDLVLQDAIGKAAPRQGSQTHGAAGAAESAGAELVKLRARREAVERAHLEAERRKTTLRQQQALLRDEVERLRRAVSAGELLSELKVTHCPACDRALDPSDNTTVCYVCRRPDEQNKPGKQNAKSRFELEESQLDGELEETADLVTTNDREIARHAAELQGIDEAIRTLETSLAPLRSAVAAALPPEVAIIDTSSGRIEARLQQLDRVKSALAGRAAFDEEIRKLEEEVRQLEVRVQAQRSSIDFDSAGDLLQQGMSEYLEKIRQLNPQSWTQGGPTVRFGERSVSLKIGGRLWRTKLGGTLTLYFLLAYHYALMRLTPRSPCHYPGLCILDFPAKLEDGSQVGEKENFVVRPFVELLATEPMAATQVIIAGSSFENLPGAHRIPLTTVWK